MKLKFEKWHGCKNDFIVTRVFENDTMTLQSLCQQASALCSRQGGGIGADGLIILHPKSKTDLFPNKITIINSDGSMAATCGNGLRCAALSVLKAWRDIGNPLEPPEGVEFQITANSELGRKVFCRYLSDRTLTPGDRLWPLVSVDMGQVQMGSEVGAKEKTQIRLAKVIKENHLDGRINGSDVCAIGNLHLVVFASDADCGLMRQLGPPMQEGQNYDGINVHVAKGLCLEPKEKARLGRLFSDLSEDGFEVWVWERGAGETQACGSGACAVVVAAAEQGDAPTNRWVPVKMPGGMLLVNWNKEERQVTLAGPAEFIFDGVLDF